MVNQSLSREVLKFAQAHTVPLSIKLSATLATIFETAIDALVENR